MLGRALAAFLCCVASFAQSPVSIARLAVEVRSEAALAWDGSSAIVVKARIAQGAELRLWIAETCAVPSTDAKRIRSSGVFVIDLPDIAAIGATNVCLLSSDATIHKWLAVPQETRSVNAPNIHLNFVESPLNP